MKNIKIKYKNGVEDEFILESTSDLKLPSLAFKTEEEAQFAVALAKLMVRSGLDYWSDLTTMIKFIFRIIRIDSEWTE